MIGDGGEFYVAAMLNLHGTQTAVMPRGWPCYDLAADTGSEVQKIQVKTVDSSRPSWKRAASMRGWNPVNTRKYDWLALVLWGPTDHSVRVWIIPADVAEEGRQLSKSREILFATVAGHLERYENNWGLERKEPELNEQTD
jgi:hypothetical protein